MKNLISILLGCLLPLTSLYAARQNEGTVTGSIQDASGAPVSFASVYFSGANGKIVAGTASDEEGNYRLTAAPGEYTMSVALIGYKQVSFPFTLRQGLQTLDPIRLEDDDILLMGASLSVVVPKTKITGEGLQTSVRGSVLEHAGSASDVLEKTPGMIKGQNGLEVIGKGAPLVYINGRKVTDSGELDRLRSEDIQSIEVISNPGAQYDATVRSVVRIKTIKRQGEGFGFSLDASDAQSLHWKNDNDSFAAVNVNYRTGGLDFFGGLNYSKYVSHQYSDATTESWSIKNDAPSVFKNVGVIDAEGTIRNMHGNAGVNWQLADNHFLGGKLEWGRRLGMDDRTVIDTDVYENDLLVDRLSTTSNDVMGDPTPYDIGGNLYYNGQFGGKLGVDINLDYYGTSDAAVSSSEEVSTMTHDAAINSVSGSDARLYAAKAVFSYPVWKGELQAGTEETVSCRTDHYSITGIDSIKPSEAAVTENNYAGFASYGFMLPKAGMFSAGIRYEFVHYSFEDEEAPEENILRDYGHWFPTFSYSGVLGPVQLMINYSAKTQRPSYHHLSSAIRYNSRYIWQSGNARLQPEISQELGLTAVWKWMAFVVNYSRMDDKIMLWSMPYNDDGVVLVKPRNIDTPYRVMAAYVNITPTVGPWSINYTFGAVPQWLSINAPDPREASGIRTTRFNGKPLFVAMLQNTLSLKGGWQLEFGGTFQSKGYTENLHLDHHYIDIKAAVQKTLLKDGSLVLRLEGNDLTGMAHYDITSDFGSHLITQTNLLDTQKIKLSVRYNFNSAKSKYRGTGAGADEKARM